MELLKTKSFEKAFTDLDFLLFGQGQFQGMNRQAKDAIIHGYILDNGKEDHAKISYRAIVAHIKYELKTKKQGRYYYLLFKNNPIFKRIINGLPA